MSKVCSILHRIEELSVQGANGVLNDEDKISCDAEIQELKKEIDKIGNSTQFNGIYLFQGRNVEVGAEGTTFADVTIDQLELGYNSLLLSSSPFSEGDAGNYLKLGVRTKETSNVAGVDWRLIYGNGMTSYPSVRISYNGLGDLAEQTFEQTYEVKNVQFDTYDYDDTTNTWSREGVLCSGNTNSNDGAIRSCPNITIRESVQMIDSGDEKYYKITYGIASGETDHINSIDFMYNCDTAYNNDDRCEGYYINGNRVSSSMIYTTDTDLLAVGNSNVISGIPTGFSVCDLNSALQFTEKIKLDSSDAPDILSLGLWTKVDKWNYYDALSGLGENMRNADLAYSMIWHNDLEGSSGTWQKDFVIYQGIAETSQDNNLAGLTYQLNNSRLIRHESIRPLYIQTGAVAGEDMLLEFEEMNSDYLGMRGMGCLTGNMANDCMDKVKSALNIVNAHRSRIGAWQNRLEHTYSGNVNYSENLTSAESNIRDTDMAKELSDNSRHNILIQASQAMIAQANQQNQGVLQ